MTASLVVAGGPSERLPDATGQNPPSVGTTSPHLRLVLPAESSPAAASPLSLPVVAAPSTVTDRRRAAAAPPPPMGGGGGIRRTHGEGPPPNPLAGHSCHPPPPQTKPRPTAGGAGACPERRWYRREGVPGAIGLCRGGGAAKRLGGPPPRHPWGADSAAAQAARAWRGWAGAVGVLGSTRTPRARPAPPCRRHPAAAAEARGPSPPPPGPLSRRCPPAMAASHIARDTAAERGRWAGWSGGEDGARPFSPGSSYMMRLPGESPPHGSRWLPADA